MSLRAPDDCVGNRSLWNARRCLITLALTVVFLIGATTLAAEPMPGGKAAENRFPPLKLPQGFAATLYACDPFIEYPSVVAVGPWPGSLFVAIDYMTGLGTEIIRRDEVRLLEDTDGDGYADKSTVFAAGLNSIEGIAWSENTLFVMHAPFLTALKHQPNERVATNRKDIVAGLGLPPEENPVRLHCANGVTAARDGWLYLALGDHGCGVSRPEGDRLVFEGGGILRCRPDGRDLHVFARGLRNIYDVALDDELNVLVRDNENDGGTYKQRVYHSFFGADHGYPYLYETRQDEALAPLADVGLGSSAGAVCYLAEQFPAEFLPGGCRTSQLHGRGHVVPRQRRQVGPGKPARTVQRRVEGDHRAREGGNDETTEHDPGDDDAAVAHPHILKCEAWWAPQASPAQGAGWDNRAQRAAASGHPAPCAVDWIVRRSC